MSKETCPHCGAMTQPGALQCAVCGAPLGETPIATSSGGLPGEATAASPQQDTAPGIPAYGGYPATTGVYPYPTAPGYPAPNPYPATPAYPTQPGGAPYPAGGYGAYGYPHYYNPYGYYYAPYYPARPRRAPGEVYALVIAWIVTALSAISVVSGLIVIAITLFALYNGQGDDLSFMGGILGFSVAPLLGGAFGLWYGIFGILRRPSPRFQLPPAWGWLALTLLAIGGGLALWIVNQSLNRAPGVAGGMLPLATLAGALPALAILAFTTQRLGDPSTRRHVWMSMFYGMTLAALIAVVLEAILSFIIVLALGLSGQDAQSVLSNTGGGSQSARVTLAMFLILSVVAPLVEEGAKPLGALLAIRRLRAPGEAFLVGLAAGVGFDMFETIGYIGTAQADWVSVAIERIGAGLLHGVGAGMTALGWYYLINGKGVRLRWLRGIGCGLYAVVQHSLFNALSLFDRFLPQNISDWLSQPAYLGTLPLQRMDMVIGVLYAVILTVLIVMTNRLLGAKGMPAPEPPAPSWPSTGYPYAPYPYIPWGYGLTPGTNPATPGAVAPQTVGGAR